MSITFKAAVRENTSLIVGLAGPSSSGKTLSALKIARGLVGNDEKIFFIDTEQGRALHYACAPGESPGPFKFRFQYAQLDAPFSPERYAEAVSAATKAGAAVIIIDSLSHEHESTGGILELHEEMLTKMAGADYSKRERMKFAAWIEPKKRHNRFVGVLLQQRPHIIACFRAKDKLQLVKNKQGKMEPVNVGWTAICSDRFEYECTALLMLPPNSKGVPDLEAPHCKLQEQHRAFVKPGQPIDESLGKALAAWAAGGAAPAPRAVPPLADPDEGLPTAADVRGILKDEVPHDPETGEITPGPLTVQSETVDSQGRVEPDIFPPHEPPQPSAEEIETIRAWTNKTIAKFDKVTEASVIDDWLASSKVKAALARAHLIDPEAAMAAVTAADARKKKIEQEKFTGELE